jgi:hypothetical protein
MVGLSPVVRSSGMAKKSRIALGFRAHSGWAAVVAIGGSRDAPVVLMRTRIELADPEIPESIQPYHSASELDIAAAGIFIRRCAAATKQMARKAMRDIAAQLQKSGHEVVACGNLLGSGHSPASLAAALASHPMLHTAEGEFYRNALDDASRHLGLKVVGVREKEIIELGSAMFGIASDKLQRTLTELGKPFGSPWRQDEKLATLAAWLALAENRARR